LNLSTGYQGGCRDERSRPVVTDGEFLDVATILCIDSESAVAGVLEGALEGAGHRVLHHGTLSDGLRSVTHDSVDLVVSSHQLPDGTGLQLLGALREQGFDVPVIMTSPHSSVEHAVLSMRHGAVDYVTKPLRAEAVRIAVTNAIELDRMRRINEDYRSVISSLRGSRAIVGHSRALQRVMEVVASVAPTKATVLLEGESGTGKELFARAIHERSPRAHEPFVTVNCAALPEGLVESSLFGHERGAFTGAAGRTLGAFERADRGTLLLDEVSEMQHNLQAKLLRAIQEQEIERVGGHQLIRVDTRIVATTNRDLLSDVEAGRFRRDLYYRLNVVPVHTPSLRERIEDIPVLVEHFIAKVAGEIGVRPPPTVAPEALEMLRKRPWSGNIRELANAVERAVILGGRSRVLHSEAFGPPPPAAADPASAASRERGSVANPPGRSPESTAAAPDEPSLNLRELERITIQRALEATGGRRNRAAQLLGISDRTLRNKLKQ